MTDNRTAFPGLGRYFYTFLIVLGLLHIALALIPVAAGRIDFRSINLAYLAEIFPSPAMVAMACLVVSAIFTVDCAIRGFSLIAAIAGVLIISGLGAALSIWFLSAPMPFVITGNAAIDYTILLVGAVLVLCMPLYFASRRSPERFGR